MFSKHSSTDTRRHNFWSFVGFESFWGVSIPLTHWVTIFPGYLYAIGAPTWAIALMPQSLWMLGIVAQLVTLRWLSCRPRRRGMAVGLLLSGSLLLPVLAGAYYLLSATTSALVAVSLVLIIGRFFIYAVSAPVYYGLIGEVVPRADRGRLMGARQLALGLSGLVGGALAAWLLSRGGRDGYAWCFLLASGFCLLGGWRLHAVRETPRTTPPGADHNRIRAQLRVLLHVVRFRWWLAAHLCLVAALGGVGILTVHYQRSDGNGASLVGQLTFWMSAAMAVSGPLAGWLGDRAGYRLTGRLLMLGYAAVFGLTSMAGYAWLAIPCFIVLGAGQCLMELWMVNYLVELMPRANRVTLMAAAQLFASPVAIASALGFGALVDLGWSPRVVLLGPLSLAVAGLALTVFKLPEPRRDKASPAT